MKPAQSYLNFLGDPVGFDMPDDEQEKVRELTFDMLRRLASDQLPRVRALLADRDEPETDDAES